MHVKYKIHALSTVEGTRRSAGNSKFYDTYDEALLAARRCFATKAPTGIVIFKAIKLVRTQEPPIIVEDIPGCE